MNTSNEKKPFTMDKKKVLALLIMFLVIALVLVYHDSRVEPITTTKNESQFVIASWDYPDEYGQGLLEIRVNENSTGAWVLVDDRRYNETQNYDWNTNASIQLYVWMWLNSTLTGASDLEDGRNYLQCNVTVTSLGETIFSQQNFTFQDENDYDDMYLYEYDVILNFIPVSGTIYIVTVTYEVYW